MSKLKRWSERTRVRIKDRVVTTWRPERVLFIHIAKTAGTSLRRMLEDEYGPRYVYPGTLYLQDFPHGWYPLGSELLREYRNLPPHNVLVGHFTAAMADGLPRRYRTATVLRDPVQRSLSMLGHFSETMNVTVPALIKDVQFMTDNITDFQTRILGAEGVCEPHLVDAADDAVLARAIARLETLDFVGLTERFAESCAMFDDRFGTSISGRIRRDGVRRTEGTELAEYIPLVEPLVERDRVLYESAVARFDASLTGSSP